MRGRNLFLHAANPIFAGAPFALAALQGSAFEFALRKLRRDGSDEGPDHRTLEPFECSCHPLLPGQRPQFMGYSVARRRRSRTPLLYAGDRGIYVADRARCGCAWPEATLKLPGQEDDHRDGQESHGGDQNVVAPTGNKLNHVQFQCN